MLRKVLRYFCAAICRISVQEILLVTASILSYVLYGTVMRTLYLWIIVLACDAARMALTYLDVHVVIKVLGTSLRRSFCAGSASL